MCLISTQKKHFSFPNLPYKKSQGIKEKAMLELMNEMNATIAKELPLIVQTWMNWMVGIFLASIFFVFHKTSAKYIFITIVLTLASALVIFHYTKNIHLFSIPHFLIWAPLAYYLSKYEILSGRQKLVSLYGIYLVLLLLTIFTSLVFDTKDMFLIIQGLK